MNKILISFAVATLACGAVSCSGFLDEKVPTQLSADNIYSTKDALENNINSCYVLYSNPFFNTQACNLTITSGLSIWGLGTSSWSNNINRNCCLKLTQYAKNSYSKAFAQNMFQGIYRCNTLIENLQSSPVDESYKKQIEGEAKFMRANYLFSLVRLFGDVTMVTKAPKSLTEINQPRKNFWEVYCQIIKDMNFAVENCRTYDQMCAISGPSSGRITNYGARARRALVYLTIGTLLAHPDDNYWLPEKRTPDFSEIGITSAEDAFIKARDDAEEVINNGPYELAPSYAQLFRWTDKPDWELKERIFVATNTREGRSDNKWNTWVIATDYMNSGSSSTQAARPARFLYQKWAETYGGIKGKDKYNKNIYVGSTDPRFDLSFIHYSYPGKDMKATGIYPGNSYVQKNGAAALPSCKKMYDPTYKKDVGLADLYIMRFAEVYLIAAEAYANLCETPTDPNGVKACEKVNVILKRARNSTTLDGKGTPSAEPRNWGTEAGERSFATKDELITALWWERAFELMMEGHDYYDIRRMGAKWLVENIAKPKNIFLYRDEQSLGSKPFRDNAYGKDYKLTEDWREMRKSLIFGYPYDELVYNTALDPNRHDPNFGQNPEEVIWE